MKKLFTLLICCVLYGTSPAQPLMWYANSNMLEIGNRLELVEDPEGNLTFDQVSAPGFSHRFRPSTQRNINFGWKESIFWLRFSFINKSGQEPLLELVQAILPTADLYYKDDHGKTVHLKSGYRVPLNEKVVKNHFQVFPLPTRAHEFYLRVFSSPGPIPVRIYAKPAYEVKSNNQKLIYGFYLGFMFFLMLSNLFFFFSLRNRIYLFYSFNVLVYACYAVAVVDGFLPYLFPKADLLLWYTTVPTIGVIVQNLYCITFLEVRKYSARLYRSASIIIGYFVVYAILKFWLPLPVVLGINTVNALLSFFMMGYIGFRIGRLGNRMGYYFALAFFIYFALVLCEASYIQTGTPAYFWELSHTALSTVIEALVLSFLLSKRFEWEKEAFQKANAESQRQLLEKTMENEHIVKEQNVVLEQRVNERTHQLKLSLEDVEMERQKSESLLHNILPEEIARELKQTGASEARQYDSVSVLFTDFVNFTGISEEVAPRELVAEIDFCYKAFDDIIERNGLEKIKTIGDAYLAVCGLPVADPYHAEKTVNAALEILDFVANHKALGGLFNIRTGVNSGTVVAGIVGIKKFAYDIWGDTVNTAHRMESNSEPGKLNISHTTYELIKHKYHCTYRGKIDAKHKGIIDMYFVQSRQDNAFITEMPMPKRFS